MATEIRHYDRGDVWIPQASFTVNAAPTDPTTVTVRLKNAAGTVTTMGPTAGGASGAGITRVSAGVYTVTVPLDDAGYWYCRFDGTGTAAGAVEHQAIVDPSQFYDEAEMSTRALVSLGEAKDWLQFQNVDTSSDLEIVRAINDVSDRIGEEAGREFKPYATNPSARMFATGPTGPGSPWYVDGTYMGDIDPYRRRVFVGDLAAAPTLVELMNPDWTTAQATVPAGSVLTLPLVRRPWQPIRELELAAGVAAPTVGQLVRVTGTWGFPQVPGTIRQACLDALAWILDRDVEHYRQDLGVAGGGGEANVIMVGGGGQRILSLPPTVLAAAWAYRDPAIG